ncbi:TylF/MycF/NovP-related O-methyltransferase [Streptomyces sp. NPDC005760]|uniref:TylF/MycF/NovP-related O-methyltransferase n=1 Tax=Streptomyces sp. NPDC005760 TaxID=3156718 RepID=UPI00340B0359
MASGLRTGTGEYGEPGAWRAAEDGHRGRVTDLRNELQKVLLAEQPRTVDRGRMPLVERYLTTVIETRVEGAVVELGCFAGAMAAWMRTVLDGAGDGRPVHAFGAFAELPAPGPEDGNCLKEGEFPATEKDVYVLHDRFGLRRPLVYAGWLTQTLPASLPDQIAFAYLDSYRYDSILTSLEHCVPRLAPGALLVLDGYADASAGDHVEQPKAPGVMRACRKYFGDRLPLWTVHDGCGWGLGVYHHLPAIA